MKKELVIPTDEDSIKWAELYRRYNKILYCMAIKDTKNKQDAEDALHQAFSKISQHLDKIDDPASRSAFNYCLTIMRNVIQDSYRKQSRHPEVELDEKYFEFLEKREFVCVNACWKELWKMKKGIICAVVLLSVTTILFFCLWLNTINQYAAERTKLCQRYAKDAAGSLEEYNEFKDINGKSYIGQYWGSVAVFYAFKDTLYSMPENGGRTEAKYKICDVIYSHMLLALDEVLSHLDEVLAALKLVGEDFDSLEAWRAMNEVSYSLQYVWE